MTQRRNITQPLDWWEQFERAAKANNKTLSEWIGDTCRRSLSKTQQRKLSERKPQGRPKK